MGAERIALVTGGGSGIGEACARMLASEGVTVIVVDINAEAAHRVSEDIVGAGGSASPVTADMANRDEIDRTLREGVTRFGQLDVIVNNVAATTIAAVDALEFEHWQRSLDVCLTAYWWASRRALEHMRSRHAGSIVNIASTAGLAGDYSLAAYCAAKAGVLNLTRVTAIETARDGIRCNAVCPGTI